MDRIAIVTGGGQGLGRAVANALHRENCRVAIFGRNGAKLKSAAASIGADVLAVPVDISRPDDVRAAFEIVDAELGEVSILVNNAALFSPFAIEDADDSRLLALATTNLLGTTYCIREAVILVDALNAPPDTRAELLKIRSACARNRFWGMRTVSLRPDWDGYFRRNHVSVTARRGRVPRRIYEARGSYHHQCGRSHH